jgi:hydrogenase expression/formation protein HypC
MCLAIPGRIVEIVDDTNSIAKVDVSGVKRNVNIALVREEGADVGTWVLIHVGFALSTISEDEAQLQMSLLAALGEDELAIEEIKGYRFE